MSSRYAVLALLLVIGIILAACGAAEPQATSVAAPAAATDTQVPPTEPPVDTPVPPTERPEDVGAPSTEPTADTPEAPATETEALPTEAPPTEAPAEPPTEAPAPTETPEPELSAQGFLLEGVGFSVPESVLYDPEADIYLVANINGDPRAEDGNGFISRISPTGEVEALKWIDGAVEGLTLNAPKGMALAGDSLFVADINTVRIFDRQTGEPIGEVAIAGASFLNDVAAAEDGTIYVTDSATGLVFTVAADHSYEQWAGVQLEGPNGIDVAKGTVLVAAGGPLILKLDGAGQTVAEYNAPAGGLDGLVLLEDGSILVSSWQGSAVYLIAPDGQATELFGGFDGPADIGFDAKRRLVLIPHFNTDRVEAKPLP